MRTLAIILALTATSCTTANEEPRGGNENTSLQNPSVPLSTPRDQTAAKGEEFTEASGTSSNDGNGARLSEPAQSPTFYVARNTLRQPILPEGFTAGTLKVRQNCFVFEAGDKVFSVIVPSRARFSGEAQRWEMTLDQKVLRLDRPVNLAGGAVPTAGPESVVLDRPIPSRCPRDMFAIS